MGKNKNGVPDRWEAYSKIGKVVEGTPFISFKVPLKQELLDKVPKDVDNKWKVEDLIEAIPSPGLGLVIDLTFTTRYYDSQKFTSNEIGHKKVMTKGHEIPNSFVVKQFYAAVDEVLAKEDRKLIGVHCTHGLNRTGYLICRYMIQKLGVDPEVAIAAFDEARGHKQERLNYINHLKTKGWENESKEEHKNTTYGDFKAAREGGGKMPSDRNRDGMRGAYNNGRGFTHGTNDTRDYDWRRGRYADWQAHNMNPGTSHYQERFRDRRGASYGRGYYEGDNGGRNVPYSGDPAGYEQNYGEWRANSGGSWGYGDNYWSSGDWNGYGRVSGSEGSTGKNRSYQEQGRAGPYSEGFGRRGSYGGDSYRGRHETGHFRGRGRTDNHH